MLVKRIVAELMDIVILFLLLMGILYGIATIEFLGSFEYSILNTLALFSVVIICVSAPILLQYLFWKEGRSIGKTYVGLVVIDLQTNKPAGFSTMLVRETFSKWISCWVMCIPVFFGKKGVHESATRTEVRLYTKSK
ncbi:RDD family protein [Natranaerovirga pectinivora]|uniref:RDD family protein n=1 Tax=Natranaerovirga pectinivora TaxID=682400 RepID=A0A4R3MI96_9FIRM|nr:RDD family protein [Natranaerovirga pectinivora]TCT13838.1 RDD family protein [Natranaerovirga pectinivora]